MKAGQVSSAGDLFVLPGGQLSPYLFVMATVGQWGGGRGAAAFGSNQLSTVRLTSTIYGNIKSVDGERGPVQVIIGGQRESTPAHARILSVPSPSLSIDENVYQEEGTSRLRLRLSLSLILKERG